MNIDELITCIEAAKAAELREKSIQEVLDQVYDINILNEIEKDISWLRQRKSISGGLPIPQSDFHDLKLKYCAQKPNYLTLFSIVSLVILALAIAYPVIVWQIAPDWGEAGTFGDSYGALNAIFSGLAFTGVIITILIQREELKNQRKELQLQREEMQLQRQEMKDTRGEFMVSRITNLIYKQLERVDIGLSSFWAITDEGKLFGQDAFIAIHAEIKHYLYAVPDDVYEGLKKEENLKIVKKYLPNDEEYFGLAIKLYTSANVVQEAILSSGLSIVQMNELKRLFFGNIGHHVIWVLEELQSNINDYNVILDSGNLTPGEVLELGKLTKANMYLARFIDFNKTEISKENINDLRKSYTIRKEEYNVSQ